MTLNLRIDRRFFARDRHGAGALGHGDRGELEKLGRLRRPARWRYRTGFGGPGRRRSGVGAMELLEGKIKGSPHVWR